MGNRRRLQNQLAALLKQYDADIERAFLEAIRNKANSINLAELTAAIEARDQSLQLGEGGGLAGAHAAGTGRRLGFRRDPRRGRRRRRRGKAIERRLADRLVGAHRRLPGQ